MYKQCQVTITKRAQKQFRKLPERIRKSFRTWALLIDDYGIATMRKIPGYHDEPLKGERKGQRSSRLSRSYRVIYEELESGEIVIISVLEVSKYEY